MKKNISGQATKTFNLIPLKQTIHWIRKEVSKTVKALNTAIKIKDRHQIKFNESRLLELANKIIWCDKELIQLGLVER